MTRRPINSAVEPHGRTAAGSLDHNNSVATNRPAHGGASKVTQRRLMTLTAEFETGGTIAPPPGPKIKPGSRLVREWHGRTHTVYVTDVGYDTQLVLLSAASRRDDHCLVPPAGAKRGRAQRAVAKLLEAGLLKEIRAKAGAPIWRRDDETGQTYALKLTTAGAKAIAVDDATASESMGERRADHPIVSANPKLELGSGAAAAITAAIDKPNRGGAATPTSPRGGTKIAQVIELLQRSDGATVDELVVATGWLPHTTRAALTGLRKRGYAVGIDRADKARGSVYRIGPTETDDDSAAPHVGATPTCEAPSDRPERAASLRVRRAA